MKKLIDLLDRLRSNRVLFAILVIVSFVLVYILNMYYPLLFDDWAYSLADGQRRVESFSDIYHSQYAHYFGWGGRSVVHAIAQWLLMYPPSVHDIINSFALIALLLIFYKISNYGKRLNVWIYIIIGLLMWFVQPGFASVYFWITGSANYMWGMLIIILFLCPLYSYYRDSRSDYGSWWTPPLALITGVLAGWTNENMAVGLVAFMICSSYILIKEKRKIPIWLYFGLVGVIIGAAFMIAAPGNAIRFASEAKDRGMDLSESLINISRMFKAIPNMIFLYFKRLSFIVIPYLFLLKSYKKQNQNMKDGDNAQKVWRSSLLFFATGNVAFFAMTASLLFPSRAYFGIISCIIIAFAILLSNYKFEKLKVKKGLLIFCIVAVLGLTVDYVFVKLKTFRRIDKVFEERARLIKDGKKEGHTEFVFYDGLKKISGRLAFDDCTDDPNFWINTLYARFYDVSSVKVYSADAKKLVEEQEEVVK